MENLETKNILDDWPRNYSHLWSMYWVIRSTLAPWNAIRFLWKCNFLSFSWTENYIEEETKKLELIFLPATLIENVYKPYGQDLKHAVNLLETAEFSWKTQVNNENMLRRFYMMLKRLRHISHLLVPSNYMKWQ